MKKQLKKSLKTQKASNSQTGLSEMDKRDPTIQHMLLRGLPLTKKTYMELQSTGEEDEMLNHELLAEVPEFLMDK